MAELHLLASCVLLLAADCVVVLELARIILLVVLVFLGLAMLGIDL